MNARPCSHQRVAAIAPPGDAEGHHPGRPPAARAPADLPPIAEPDRAPLALSEHGSLTEINPACELGQRWWHGRHSWTQRSEGGFDPRDYEVHPISDPITKSYVERMHYSGSYVAASRRYGMFIHTPDGLDMVGVAVFGIPAQSRVLTNVFPDLEPYAESLELARFVLEGQPLRAAAPAATRSRAPGNSEGWFLRECLRYLAGDGIVGVVSFAVGTETGRRHNPLSGPCRDHLSGQQRGADRTVSTALRHGPSGRDQHVGPRNTKVPRPKGRTRVRRTSTAGPRRPALACRDETGAVAAGRP